MSEPNHHVIKQLREHLFSPHTDQCVYCGQSAKDDAIENTPCVRPPCKACGARGWLFCNTGNDASPRYEIQRCDRCGRYVNDLAALQSVVKAAQSQLELLAFAQEVSDLWHEDEPGDDGEPYEPTSEDAIATLNQLIAEARQLLGTADKCDECGEIVPYVIGRPDGVEVCRDCFEAGQH